MDCLFSFWTFIDYNKYMSEIVAGYARVSSNSQNEARQIAQLQGLVTSDRFLYVDKASGKDFERTQYCLMKQMLRHGDTLVITSLDRLGRNAQEMEKEWKYFQEMGIKMRILDMPILDTREDDDAMNRLIAKIVFDLLSYFAEMERNNIKARQREGIEMAKKEGRALGRPRKTKITPEAIQIICQYEKGFLTANQAALKLNIGRSTFYKLLTIYKENMKSSN